MVSNCTFQVNVTRAPLPPVLNVTSFTVPELSANGTLVGNVAAFDPNAVGITSLAFVRGYRSEIPGSMLHRSLRPSSLRRALLTPPMPLH